MTRMLSAVAAAVLAATLAGAAYASPVQSTPAATTVTAAHANPQIRWHMEWRYHYGHHNEWVPGWVAVLNDPR